jgi:hypothetical protein
VLMRAGERSAAAVGRVGAEAHKKQKNTLPRVI